MLHARAELGQQHRSSEVVAGVVHAAPPGLDASVEQRLAAECLVGVAPGVVVHGVHQLVLARDLQRVAELLDQLGVVLQAADHHEQAGSHRVHGRHAQRGSTLPVRLLVTAPPGGHAVGLHVEPDLVAQLGRDHGRLVLVPPRHERPVLEPLALGVLGGVPEAVPVADVAAPVGGGVVVVEDDPEVGVGQCLHDRVVHLERGLALELRVGSDPRLVRHLVVAHHLVRPRQPHRVEAGVGDLLGHVGQRATVQPSGHLVRRLGAVPVDRTDRELRAVLLDDAHAALDLGGAESTHRWEGRRRGRAGGERRLRWCGDVAVRADVEKAGPHHAHQRHDEERHHGHEAERSRESHCRAGQVMPLHEPDFFQMLIQSALYLL